MQFSAFGALSPETQSGPPELLGFLLAHVFHVAAPHRQSIQPKEEKLPNSSTHPGFLSKMAGLVWFPFTLQAHCWGRGMSMTSAGWWAGPPSMATAAPATSCRSGRPCRSTPASWPICCSKARWPRFSQRSGPRKLGLVCKANRVAGTEEGPHFTPDMMITRVPL